MTDRELLSRQMTRCPDAYDGKTPISGLCPSCHDERLIQALLKQCNPNKLESDLSRHRGQHQAGVGKNPTTAK